MKTKRAIGFAVLAALLYALNAPFSKLLLSDIPSTMMAGLLYIGAGIGMSLLRMVQKAAGVRIQEQKLTRSDLPYTIAMVVLDIAAPIALMSGLQRTTAANASLLNNFEIVATTLIALCFFHEKVSGRLWIAVILITIASMILSVEDASSFAFSTGSLLVLLACCCWGLENNCTRVLSSRDPLEIVVIKGFGSGLGSLVIALFLHEAFPAVSCILLAMLLGFVAYGLSIFFYIRAQRELGASKTSAYYALSPFIAAALSLLIFRQLPSLSFLIACVIMAGGVWLASE